MEDIKPHISPSQVASFTRCGEAYRRRYVEHEIFPPGIAMQKGTSIHRGANYNFAQKVTTKEDLPLKDVVDFSVSDFEHAAKEKDFTFSHEERSAGTAVSIGKAKDSTASLAQVLMKEVAPKYQPSHTEQEILIELPTSSHDLKGYMDLRTEDKKVVELKTSAKPWTQSRVDKDFQLDFYELGHHVLFGEKASEVVIENLVDPKTGAKPVTLRRRGPKDHHRAAIARINRVLEAINAGVYPPAQKGAWWCDPRYCGYYSTCPFV